MSSSNYVTRSNDYSSVIAMPSLKTIKYKSLDYYINRDIHTTNVINVKDKHFNNIIIDIEPTYYYYGPVEPTRIDINVVVPYDLSIDERYYIHFIVVRPENIYLNVKFFRKNLDPKYPYQYIRLMNRKFHPTRDKDVYYMIKPKNGEVIFRAKYSGIKEIR